MVSSPYSSAVSWVTASASWSWASEDSSSASSSDNICDVASRSSSTPVTDSASLPSMPATRKAWVAPMYSGKRSSSPACNAGK